tara:strand:+ start:25 stop:429 length:405 start_codon:yes stop_codon:yes gene_type:complete
MNKFLIIGLSFMISHSLFATDDMHHDHKGHVHGALIDGKDLDVDPDRYQKFLKDLEDCQIAVVSVIGMVCDFCAQGLEKTFEKDRNVKKIDVDLNKGKVLIAYSKDKAIEYKEIEQNILANGQNATGLKIININ